MHTDIFSENNCSSCNVPLPISTAWKAIFICHHLLTCMHKTHKSMINVMRSGFEGSALILCTPGSYEVMTAIYQTVIYAIIININGGD